MKLGRYGKRDLAFTDVGQRPRVSRPRTSSSEIAEAGLTRPAADAARRRSIGWVRPRCRWAAARIRSATGVNGPALGRERPADQGTPWLGLLLWAIACAGLLVSLLMQSDGLPDDPRMAASTTIKVGYAAPHPSLILIGQTVESSAPARERPLPH